MPSLLELREATGRSRSEVARDLGVNEKFLYRLEKGHSPLRQIIAIAFASYYGVDEADITAEKAA